MPAAGLPSLENGLPSPATALPTGANNLPPGDTILPSATSNLPSLESALPYKEYCLPSAENSFPQQMHRKKTKESYLAYRQNKRRHLGDFNNVTASFVAMKVSPEPYTKKPEPNKKSLQHHDNATDFSKNIFKN